MVLEDGQPKGLKMVLEERGKSTDKMKKQDKIDRLAQEDDFLSEACQSVIFLRDLRATMQFFYQRFTVNLTA